MPLVEMVSSHTMGDRVKQDVEKVDHRRQRPVKEVGVVAEDRFGQELGAEDDDDGRYGRIRHHRTALREPVPAQGAVKGAQKQRHCERIDDQRDVVAHEDRGDVLSRVAGENRGDPVEQAALLAVDLQFETVLARKGNLHPREKGRQQEHHDDQDDSG